MAAAGGQVACVTSMIPGGSHALLVSLSLSLSELPTGTAPLQSSSL